MLRLLKKSEIAAAQANDRAKEIQEGLKISRRVDSLRELATKEEATLEKFRSETLRTIGSEISELEGKKDSLKIELVYLREELTKETTLSRDERKNLEALKATLEEKDRKLNAQSEELALAEIDIAIAIKNSQDAVARSRSHEEISKNLHVKAENLAFEAEQKLENTKKIEKSTLKTQKSVEEELFLKQEALKERENSITAREKENASLTRELEAEKIRIADREATLERALARLKNNRLA